MNPLLTVRGAITSGFVAAIVLSLLISPTAFGELGLAHVRLGRQLRCDAHQHPRPFARIVGEVTQHLLEILLLALEP